LTGVLGSLRLITDGAGSVAGGASYDPWGQPKAGAATTLGGFGFAGEQQDAESGFLFLRARSYDPATGRFLQEDPADLAGSGTSLYAYTDNNPATLTDPSGMFLDTILDIGFIGYERRCLLRRTCLHFGACKRVHSWCPHRSFVATTPNASWCRSTRAKPDSFSRRMTPRATLPPPLLSRLPM
jgi:RHS repeat-associated protein